MVQKQTTLELGWDDLRYALVLSRTGSVRSAARAIGVSHSTVLRRVTELEDQLGVRLFERDDGVYRTTEAGHDVCATAAELEDGVTALARRVEGRDTRLAGPVRIALPDALLRPLFAMFDGLRRAHPDIELTLLTGSRYVDLAHREADLALRIAADPPPDLVGRRIANVAAAVYGSKQYLKGKSAKQLGSLDWVRFDERLNMSFDRWIDEHVKKPRTILRVSEAWAIEHAIDQGLGVGVLPCMAGDAHPNFVRVRELRELPASPLWVLTHADLRGNARVRAVRDLVVEALVGRRAQLEGV